MKTKSKTLKHPFSSDRPILARKDDLLGRAGFSERVAEAISRWREKDSLVLAVNGKWGDGKSSVKNMIVDALNAEDEDARPEIIEFNPWQWQEKTLSEAFFHEIAISLGSLEDPNAVAEIYNRWQEYAASLQLTNTIFDSTLSVVRWMFGIGGVASLIFSALLPEGIRPFLGVLGVVVLMASVFTKFLEKIAAPLTKLAELRKARSSKPISELKRILTETLSQLANPIIVIVDDLDRLRKDEVKAIFQIIKANADFPNFIYLLFFQRDIVERCLDEPEVFEGSEYLEKIVQVSFNLPQTPINRVHDFLAAGIEATLRSEGVFSSFEGGRWQDLFVPGLRNYFSNLRDVNRFLSTLGFHFGLLRVNGTAQVNSLDLIALEVLRQFEPSVYEGIFGNKEIFTSGSPDRDHQKEAMKKIVTDLISGANESGAAGSVIKSLFPNIRWVFENYSTTVGEDDYRRLRICHPKVFDRYFQLRLPDGDISQSEIDKAMSVAGDREAFRLHLLDLHRRGMLATFLDRFEAYKEEVDLAHATDFITAIFDIGDLLEGETSFLTISEAMHARRIVHWLLRKDPDREKRKAHVLAALRATTGTYLPVDWIRGEMNLAEKDKYPEGFNFEPTDFDELKAIGRETIHRAVADGSLRTSKHLPAILFPWLDFETPERVKAWVTELISTDEGLLQFLRCFVQKVYSHSMGSYASNVSYRIRPKTVSFIIPFDQLVERTKRLSPAALNEHDRTCYEAVLEAEDRIKNPSKYRGRLDEI